MIGLLVANLSPLPVHGQTTFIVDRQTVTPLFPERITFRLEAHVGSGTITRAELSYKVQGDPYTRGVVGELTPGARVTATAEVDTQIDYIPPGVTLDYYWTLTDDGGRRFDTPRAVVRYDDERFPWQTRMVQAVRVHWQGDRAAFGDLLADAVAGAATQLQAQTVLTLPMPVEVWVYPTEEDLLSALPPGEPEWVGGQAFPRLNVVVASIADDEQAETEARRVLPHELAHLAVAAASRNPYNVPPVWLNEGLAVHNQQDSDPFLDEILERAARANALLPLRTLESSFPADPDAALLSYAESAGAVRFLLDHYGGERVQRLLAAFQQGVTYDEALQQALGVTVDQLDTAWRATLPLPQGAAPGSPTAPVAAPTPGPGGTSGAVPTATPSGSPAPVQVDTVSIMPMMVGAVLCAGLLLAVGIVGAFWLRRRARRP